MNAREAKKVYTIFGGINGAGKSTLYQLGTTSQDEIRVNCDEILVSLGGDWRNADDEAKAMKIAAAKLKACINGNESFDQETTLAGKGILRDIKMAKENDFYIRLHYVGLDSADLAIKRIAQRVLNGGHGIDDDVVRRRYEASLKMLRAVIPLCDEVSVFDNSHESAIKVAHYKDKKWSIYNTSCKWFNRAVPEVITSI